MTKRSRGKRPCCICRKWFLPDVRQKGRQKTCGPPCKRELHRRQCEKWNKQNRDYFQSNYLSKQIEAAEQAYSITPSATKPGRRPPILPYDTIVGTYGTRHLVVLRYLIALVLRETRIYRSGIP